MLSKIYLLLFLVVTIFMAVMSALCYSWLQSIGDPAAAAQNYTHYASISWTALWISFISLIVFANVILWKDGRAWALWTSLLFFVAFIVVQTFWLDQSFFSFQKANNLTEKSYFLKPFLGSAISIVAGMGVFFNQFIVTRLRDKMTSKDEIQEEVDQDEEKED